MLERPEQRSPILALRDATAVSVQYGLGMRNQEIWALTIGDVAGPRAAVGEVLSYRALDAGKTERAICPSRRPPIDALLADDLTAWTTGLAAREYRTAADDFLLRGDPAGHGAPDGHMTGNQAHKWPGKYFTPAVRKIAEQWPDEHRDIVGATPYSLRRGMISLRIRAGEDRQAIAKHCGTSVEMLERS
jgi:integrase